VLQMESLFRAGQCALERCLHPSAPIPLLSASAGPYEVRVCGGGGSRPWRGVGSLRLRCCCNLNRSMITQHQHLHVSPASSGQVGAALRSNPVVVCIGTYLPSHNCCSCSQGAEDRYRQPMSPMLFVSMSWTKYRGTVIGGGARELPR
jgi:hypothetical protein